MGGAERHLLSLLRCADRVGHDVVVLSPQQFLLDAASAAVPRSERVQVGDDSYHEAPTMRARALAMVQGLRELRSAMSRSRADILHVNNGGHPGSDLCRVAPLAGRLAGIRNRLITVNSMPWPREHSQPQVQAVADTVVWRNVNAVQCPARIAGQRLTELRGMPQSLFRYVPYGVDRPGGEDDAPALRARLLGRRKLLAGMISATSDREKGHGVFVEALARAEDAIAGVIVGPDPLPDVVDRMRELGVEDRISLEGPRSEIGAYYHALDVLVVPSTQYECLPLVVLEAMAAGTAVLASRLSGIPEAVQDGETGRLFEPGAVDELLALLSEAETVPETVLEQGAAGHDRWRRLFSVESMWEAASSDYAEASELDREEDRCAI